MNKYAAYGLVIQSGLPFPELEPVEGEAQITIRVGEIGDPPAQKTAAEKYLYLTGAGDILIRRPGIGKLLLSNGREILVDAENSIPARALYQMILGPAMGILLLQRGFAVFHASVVVLGGMAVAFMAPKGGGKSTMALACCQQGAPLLADDVMACEEREDHLLVQPAFPLLKIWPDVLEALGLASQTLPRVHPDYAKRAVWNGNEFTPQAQPLRCIFLLQDGPEIRISGLTRRAALLKILPHWYGALFQGQLLPILGLDTHLLSSSRLVNQAPIYQLRRPRSLSLLPAVARSVECFLAGELEPDPPATTLRSSSTSVRV